MEQNILRNEEPYLLITSYRNNFYQFVPSENIHLLEEDNILGYGTVL
jgi:hypothetical protein